MASVVPIQVSLSRRERNANINVGTFSESRKHSERSRWICIYPAYINSLKKVSQGRRIPANIAVENPTLAEIRDVLINAGFEVETEINKVYPRELDKYELLSRGRIRVHLKNDDGTPVKQDFPTRTSVLVYLAQTIPKLKTRGSGAAKSQTQANPSQSSSSNKSKKSNKKK